ncbi:hypothetical protein JF66_20030 [Cryobacterium sp. MLB-32]|nr:hypothetical protein JF66_20030 [Cryobacterium sp. MLB-32]
MDRSSTWDEGLAPDQHLVFGVVWFVADTMKAWRKSMMMDTQPRNLSAQHRKIHRFRPFFPT